MVTAEVGAFPGGRKTTLPLALPREGLRLPSALPGLAQNWGLGAERARTRDWESEDRGRPEGSLLGCHPSGGSTPLTWETGGLAPTRAAHARPHTSGPRHRAPGAWHSKASVTLAALPLRDAEEPSVSSSHYFTGVLAGTMSQHVSGWPGCDGQRCRHSPRPVSPEVRSWLGPARGMWAEGVPWRPGNRGGRWAAQQHGEKSTFMEALSVSATELSRS